MFQIFKRKQNNTPLSVDIIVDASVYEKLKNRARVENVSENEELLRALKRGMSDYWLHVAKYEGERYHLIEKIFEQARRDNELLEAIINQNTHFHEILYDKYRGESTVKR